MKYENCRSRTTVRLLCVAFAVSFFAGQARAAVTNIAWYRLGENDASATSGQPVTNPTADLVGFRDLVPFGTPLYTNAVSTNAANRLGSTIAVHFNGANQFLSNAVLTADVNNFGIEAWVKPNATNNAFAFIAYNGNSSAGWGILQSGNGYYGYIQNGGLAYVGTAGAVGGTAVPGVWTHVALVRDNGANKLFINGALLATSATAPGTPAGTFTVGLQAHRSGSYFTGSMDEVRVFRFATGEFSTNDLSWNTVPPPLVVTTLPAQNIGATNATLRGTVNAGGIAAAAWFEWGTTTNYGNSTPPQTVTGIVNVSLSQTLGALNLNQTYQYRGVASNWLGIVYGTNVSFTTVPFPEATTLPASDITTNGATLNALVNAHGVPTSVRFVINGGLVPGAVLDAGSSSNDVTVSYEKTGLAPSFSYVFRIIASNAFGTAFGGNVSFTTLGPPVMATLPATNLGLSSATLQGTVNPRGRNADVWFEWGTSTNYGNTTPLQSMGDDATNLSFSQLLTNLGGGITYHFRAVGSNYIGTIHSSNRTFTIPGFTRAITNLPRIPELSGAAAWGDYDNDGLLDLLFITQTNGPVQIWRNVGGGFTNINAGLPFAFFSSVAWGDYDNDGRLDVLLTGRTNVSTPDSVTQVWRNMGSGIFSNISAGLPGVFSGSAAWGDYDNDGKLDVLLAGRSDSSSFRTEVWRNTGSGFTNINAGLPGLWSCSVAWGDYDNDGRLDILMAGLTNFPISSGVCQIWRNTGNGFSNINAGLPAVYGATVAWGDYDNDGRLDILLNGSTNPAFISQVWRNTGSGFFQVAALASYSTAAWGDYDNDGRLDVVAGAVIWRNTGDEFTNIDVGLPSGGAIIWGDYDNDGKLDLLFSEEVWRSNVAQSNTPPAAPSGLSASVAGNLVTLAWNAPGDAQTPSAGLNYNLRVGTTPGGSEVFGPTLTSTSGWRRIPQRGPQQNLSFTFNHTVSTPYYWSVQAIDHAFAGSPFATEQSFKVLAQQAVVPLTATNLAPGDVNGDGVVNGSEFAAVLANLNGNGVVSEADLNLVLSNYFPNSPFLQITNVAGLGGANVTFTLSNATVGAFSIEYSTNLTNWFPLGPATPRYGFTDTNAPSVPQRFYRLRWP